MNGPLGGARGGLIAEDFVPVRRAPGGEAPPPSILEGLTASFWASADSEGRAALEQGAIADGYAPIVARLRQMGIDDPGYTSRSARDGFALRYNEHEIWKGIAAARVRDPKAFANLPGSAAEYREKLLAPVAARIAGEQATAARAGWITRTTGDLAYGASDPINTVAMFMGAGGARTLAGAVLREGIINARLAAIEQPVEAIRRAKGGEGMTAGEAAGNVASAFVLGGIFGGAIHGGGHALRAAPDAIAGVRERAIAKHWDKLPRAVRQRWANAAHVAEEDLPDLAERALGKDRMSADERAAAQVIRTGAAIADANPFVPNGAGILAHKERFVAAMDRVLATGPADPGGSTALSSLTVPDLPARAQFKARVARAESSGGADYANPLSSARGLYQFIDSTWLRLYKRRFGDEGLSDAQILGKRRDAGIQNRLMDDLTADNAAFLRAQGEAETAGNLYLTHFLGQGRAKRVFDADPAARAADVLPAKVIDSNPFLKDMTAGDVIAWASRRMGETGPARAGARTVLADAGEAADGEALLRDRLQQELDRLDAQRVAIESTDDAAALPEEAPGVPEPVTIEPDTAPIVEAAAPPPTPEADHDLRALADRVMDLVRTGDSLAPEKVARALDIDAATAQRALTTAAGRPNSGLRIAASTGRVSRTPRRVAEPDVLRALAEAGGIRDDGGHSLIKSRDMGGAFVPGVGKLIRKTGMSIDDAGELLHEQQFFTHRPTEAEVLDLIERAVNGGERIYPLTSARAIAAPDTATRGGLSDYEREQGWSALVDQFGPEAGEDKALIDDAAALFAQGMEAHEAAALAMDYRIRQNAVILHEARGLAYDDELAAADDVARGAGEGDRNAGSGGGGHGAGARAARGSAADAADGERPAFEELEAIWDDPAAAEAQARAFEDPDGAATAAQRDSIEHDLKMALDRGAEADPAIATRKAREAQLRADSPMQAATDQESTIGTPLFDAADQGTFRLDAEGDPVPLDRILDDLDAEQADIDAIRACLPPPKKDDQP